MLALGSLILPRLARRNDSAFDPLSERAATNEARYRDMTNAYQIASKMPPAHPTRRIWEERRAALLEAGFIETRELRMQSGLTAKGATQAFLADFRSRFPGVEFTFRGYKSGEGVVTVTARQCDFGASGAIECFISQYVPGK